MGDARGMIHDITPFDLAPSPASSSRRLRIVATSATARALADQFAAFGYQLSCHDLAAPFEEKAGESACEALIVEGTGGSDRVVAVVRAAASLWPEAAIILIDRSGELVDRILALEAGADDCIGWPCDPRELLARIRAIRRRGIAGHDRTAVATNEPEDCNTVRFAGWVLDRLHRRLTGEDGRIEILSAAEFAVIDLLVRQSRRIVSREALLQTTGPASGPETRHSRAIDIQVSRLRKRIEADGEEIIRTVRGRGYMLLPTASPA
jgi:two-component system, OmpR family, response regulator